MIQDINNLFMWCKSWVAVSLLTCALIGCGIWSPEYTKPSIDTPNQWSSFEEIRLDNESELPYIAWWHKFNDPTLNQLIESGLNYNNTVKQAQGNLEQAKGQLKAVQLSWIPSISGYAGYSSNPALGAPLAFYGIWPQYAMMNIFNTIAMQKSAKLQVEARKKAVEATKLVLIGQIANSYYTYIAQVDQLQLYNVYLKDLNEVLSIQKADFKDGISSEIDVKGLASKVNQAQTEQYTIKNNIIKSQNALRYLINQNPGKVLTQANFAKFKTSYTNFGALPATVLANRPDVALAELQYRLAVQNKGKAYTQLLPSFQLDSFQGAANVGQPQSFGNPISMNDAYMAWSLSPAVFGNIDALEGAQSTAYYNYVDTVRKALKDVDDDFSNHKTANERYAATLKAYTDSVQKYELTNNLYKTGISPYLAALKDKLDVDQMAINVNQMKLIQMITLVNLYQDLGGGYMYTKDRIESEVVLAK